MIDPRVARSLCIKRAGAWHFVVGHAAWLAFGLGILASVLSVQAHIGSPNVFFQGKAGDYAVDVIIRPPQVVPGLAEVSVRVHGDTVQRVAVLPVFWNAGRKGAPPPDEAKLLRGETNLYTAALWLMKSGAYSVDIAIDGSRGHGALVVPVNSIATNTRPMSVPYRVLLSSLGLILLLLGVKIAGAIFGQSRLPPGTLPTRKDQWRGRAAMGAATVFLSLLLFGGKKWWDYEEANYRNNSLYKPLPVLAQVRTERDEHLLTLKVDSPEARGRWTPLIPDHGKIMHLFLVRDREPMAFAHLHPVPRGRTQFQSPLPPLPAGQYHLYADVTHEDGFSDTLTATAEIPPASPEMKRFWLGNSAEPICSVTLAQTLATNLFLPPDIDDSWQFDSAPQAPGTPAVALLGGGCKMIWENPGPFAENHDVSLRFKVVTPDSRPLLTESYMGMPGHAVVRRTDGAVFAHLHPLGTFSMAAQQYFALGQPAKPSGSDGSTTALQQQSLPLHLQHTNEIGSTAEISFPYAFPKAGSYRLWVQTKSQGKVLTGIFSTSVTAP